MSLLADLVETSQRVAATSGRLAKIRELSAFLRTVPADEVATAVHYLSGEIQQGRIGIGYAAVRAAASHEPAAAATQSIADVDRALGEIEAIRGAGSAARRAKALGELFSRATALEQHFLLRLLSGELRQGALAGVMLEAIAAASGLALAKLRRAAMYSPDLGAVARVAMSADVGALAQFQLQLFSPVSPMLAQTAADVGEALSALRAACRSCVGPAAQPAKTTLFAGGNEADVRKTAAEATPENLASHEKQRRPSAKTRDFLGTPGRFSNEQGEVEFEWKMDGARIQAHKEDSQVRIYTRNLNEVTAAIPEIAATVRELPARTLVLDGEAIAFENSGRPHPFQVTMRRFGRKLNVEEMRATLPIRAFFFDCLHYDGQSIEGRPTRERIQALDKAVPAPLRVPSLITASEQAASEFYDAALAAGHEGLMAKSLDAPYEAGNRGAGWLKIKRAHTLDLVVLAAEWGHGRRTGKLSNLHLGALEPATGEYVMLGKTFKGLTDAMLEWQTKELLAREAHRDEWTVYVRPEIVVEVAFSDLQESTRYPGGLALRLARVKRYREDKRSEEADTMESVRRIHASQSGTNSSSRNTSPTA
jgi:ATP-dependent DNA ligase I